MSGMVELADAFVAHKRALGYAYGDQSRIVRRFASFMDEEFPEAAVPDKDGSDAFLSLFAGKPGALYNTVNTLREFSRYLVRTGHPDAYVPPPRQSPKVRPVPPYFFGEDELDAFFDAVDGYCADGPGTMGRNLVIPAMFRLLHCCGLRCKEARLLERSDAHLADRHIDVRDSKGAKDRRVYISDELADYLAAYDAAAEKMFPGRRYFFPKGAEGAYAKGFVSGNFKRIWLRAFPGWGSRPTPRAYDLRHHFAWATINRWAREGADVNARLPYLMRYMGHKHISNTLYYFHFVPDFHADFVALASGLDRIVPEVDHG